MLQGIRTPPGGWKSAAVPAPPSPTTSARGRNAPGNVLQRAEKRASPPGGTESPKSQPGGAAAEPPGAAGGPELAPQQAGGQGPTAGGADAQLGRPGGVNAQACTAGMASSGSTLEVDTFDLSFTQGFGGATAACASTADSACATAHVLAASGRAGGLNGMPKQGAGLGGAAGAWKVGAPDSVAFSFQRVGAPCCAGAPPQLLGPGLRSPAGATPAHALPGLALPRVGETPPRSALFEPSPVARTGALGVGGAPPAQPPAPAGSPGAERTAERAAALPGSAIHALGAHAGSSAPPEAGAHAQSSAPPAGEGATRAGAPTRAPDSPRTSRGAAAEGRGAGGSAGGPGAPQGIRHYHSTAQSPGPATPAAQRPCGSLQGSAAASDPAPLDAKRLDELLCELGADLRCTTLSGLLIAVPTQCAAPAQVLSRTCKGFRA